ncbi:MAG: LytTR family DNA-binding domain-containing protein [Pseudomonadota bacterium]
MQNAQEALEERLGAEGVRRLLVYAAIITLLIISGPFGTIRDLGLLERSVYWTLAIGAGVVGAQAHDRFLRPLWIRNRLTRVATATGLLAITLAALAMVLGLEAFFRNPIPPQYILALGLSVGGVAFAIWAIVTLAAPKQRQSETHHPAFLDFQKKWPGELQAARLSAMTAEDHFVRIFTDRGEALLSGKFSDALRAVEHLDGAQVHRSWWVADQSVQTLDRTAGKWRLRIECGPEVPVSRKFRPDVRAWRWDQRRQG